MILALVLGSRLLLADPFAETAEAWVAEGDARYAARAQNARGERADPAQIEAAIRSYRRALALDPASTAARTGLLRAFFFRGAFCGETGATQKATFDEAKRLAEESMARVFARGAPRSAASQVEALRSVPGAVGLAFWSAVAWGQWSLDHKVAAVLQGAAAQLRDLGTVALGLDPAYEQGSPHLLLGRLHAEAPKIPFVTGWVSRRTALQHLRQALDLSPGNTVAQFFLADALLKYDPKGRAEALRLLETCRAQAARPESLVEDRHYSEAAARLLQKGIAEE